MGCGGNCCVIVQALRKLSKVVWLWILLCTGNGRAVGGGRRITCRGWKTLRLSDRKVHEYVAAEERTATVDCVCRSEIWKVKYR